MRAQSSVCWWQVCNSISKADSSQVNTVRMQWLKTGIIIVTLSLPLKAEEEAHSGGETPKPTPTTIVPQTSFTPIAQPSVSLVKPEIQAFLDQLRPLNLPASVLDRVRSVVEQASSPEGLQKDLSNLFQQGNLSLQEGQKEALLGLVKDQVVNPQKLQDLSLAFKELTQKPTVSDPNVSALSALQQMQGTLGQLAEKILGEAKKGSDASSSDKNFGKVLDAITAMSKNFNNEVPSSKGDSAELKKLKEELQGKKDREGGRDREGRDRDFSKADFFRDRFGDKPPGPPDRERRGKDRDRDKDRLDPSDRFGKNDRRDRRSFPESISKDDSKNSKGGDSEKTSSFTPPPPPKPKLEDDKANSALDAAKAALAGASPDKAGLPEASKTAVNTNVTPLQAMPPPSSGFGLASNASIGGSFGLTSNASIGGSFGLPSASSAAPAFGFGGGAPIQQSIGSSGGGLSVFDSDFGKMTFEGQLAPGYTGGYQYSKPVEYTVSSAAGGEAVSTEVDSGGSDYTPSTNGRVPMGPAPLNPAAGKGVRKGPEASALQYHGGLISKICNAPLSNEIGICLTLDRAKKNKENKSFFSEILKGLR